MTQSFFTIKDAAQIMRIYQKQPSIDPTVYYDHNLNSVLHGLAIQNNTDAINQHVKQALKVATDYIGNAQRGIHSISVASWINHQNKQGFTAIAYASYYGHIETIKMLLKFHADPQITTNTGINPLHLAAQNNQVLPLLTLAGKINLNLKDQQGFTVLHWAAYLRSQEVVAYLLAQPQMRIDQVNKKQQTALLLAAVFGNTRIVRQLLIHGADRTIHDQNGKKPIDYSKQHNFASITNMLELNMNICELVKLYYNIRIEYKTRNRSFKYPLLFILLSIFQISYLNALVNFSLFWITIAEAVLFGLIFILFGSLIRAPQPQPPALPVDDRINCQDYCFQCKRPNPRRGYHCDVCKICIPQYDHHCPWINNCVGKKNIGRFVSFIGFLIPGLGFLGLTSIIAGLQVWGIEINQSVVNLRWTTEQMGIKIAITLGFVIIICASLIVIPIIMLFFTQITNLLSNKTTYQRFGGKVQSNSESQDSIRSRLRKNKISGLANCKVMCSANKGSFSSHISLQKPILETGLIESF